MQKVTAICLHKGYQKIVNFTAVKANGDLVPLIHDNPDSIAYKYTHFLDMYRSLLNILKQNGFYVAHWKDFGADFYSINFIDVENPNMPKIFPFIH